MERIRQLLEQFRNGERSLPTYQELVTIAYGDDAPQCVKEAIPCASQGVCPECPLLMQQQHVTSSEIAQTALEIVHSEAGRTLSRKDFNLCMRIAKRALKEAT